MSTQHDGSGPYLRVEVTLAMAIVKSDDTILNDDMLDTTLAFGLHKRSTHVHETARALEATAERMAREQAGIRAGTLWGGL